MAGTLELERLLVRLVGDSTQYVKMLEDAGRRTQQTAQKIAQEFQRLSVAVALPLAAIGGASVKAFSDFDKAMTEAASIMDVSEQQIKDMRDAALSLSQKAVQGPVELAKGFYSLASAGLDAEQSIKALPVVAEFATAGVFELGTAIDFLAGSQAALGLKSKDAVENMENMQRVADVLVGANNMALGTVKQFAEALSNDAAAAARVFNKDVEETVAVLAAYAEQNNRGLTAGSDFARVLRLMARASIENRKEHERLGFAVFDAQGNMRNMADIVENLEQILGKLSPEMRSATLETLGFEARIQNAIFPLVGMSGKIREFEERLNKAGGATKNVAQKQMKAFANVLTVLKNTVTVTAIEIGEILAPALVEVGKAVKFALDWFRSLSPEVKQIVVGTAALVTGFIAVGAAVAALSFIGGTIGTIVGVIAGIGVALAAVEQRTGFVTKAWKSLVSFSQRVWRGVARMIADVSEEVSGIAEAFSDLWEEGVREVQSFVDEVGPELQALWDMIAEDFGELGDIWKELMPLRRFLFDFIATLVKTWGKAFLGMVKTVLSFVKTVVMGIRDFYTYWRTTITFLRDVFYEVFSDVKNYIATALAAGEFSILNFGQVFSATFKLAKLTMIGLAADFKHFFFVNLPKLGTFFVQYWQNLFKGIGKYAGEVLFDVVNTTIAAAKIVPAALAKGIDTKLIAKIIADMFEKIGDREFKVETPELKLEPREMTKGEKDLIKEIEGELKQLDEDFDKFLKDKLEKFNKPIPGKHPLDLPPGEDLVPKIDDKALEELGKDAGKNFNDGMANELNKFKIPERWEAVLADSVEAAIRFDEYRRRFLVTPQLPKEFPKPPQAPKVEQPPIGPPIKPDVFPFAPPVPPFIPPIIPPKLPEAPIGPPLDPNAPRPGGKGQNPFGKNELELEGMGFSPVPFRPQGNPFEPKLITSDVRPIKNVQEEKQYGVLLDILRELKLANKQSKPKAGGGLA